MRSNAVIALGVGVAVLCGMLSVPLLFQQVSYSCESTVLSPSEGFGSWSVTQTQHAAQIVATGQELEVGERGWTIALAVAMRESSLRNLANSNVASSLAIANDGVGSDHDSVGLFQQRPNPPEGEGSWGTVAELMDPATAATKFYQALLTIDGWQDMDLTVAAQQVQRSAYPDAYAEWEDSATQMVEHVLQRDLTDLNCSIDGDGIQVDGAALPSGFSLPGDTPAEVVTAVWWALAQLGTPYSYGGDCTDASSGDPDHECDCSSLTQQAYAAAGVTIPRTTTEQVMAGTAVPLSAIAAGDLVFIPGSLGSAAFPRHVGMSIGQGYLVQAPHTGDVVKITELSYWESEIVAIRRVV